MDIATRLDLFLDIVHQGSFSKAAKIRNTDRAVVTKQFKLLEDMLGVRLLNRTTRSIALTDAGREILKKAQKIRDEINATRRLAESYDKEPKGQLRVCSYTSFGLLYLQPAINNFIKKYPKVCIQLVLDDERINITKEQFDISFRIGPPRDSSNVAQKLASMKLAILASHSFVQKHGTPQTLQELSNLPAIIYDNGSFVFDRIELTNSHTKKLEKHSLNGNFRTNNVQSLIDATQAGIGYSITDMSVLNANIGKLGLVQLLPHYHFPADFGDVFAVYPHRNKAPLASQFISVVRQAIGEPPIWENYLNNIEVTPK
jgi:DNA-binding transcriptional LysR family regulator